jgi:hypothetical protein
MYLALGHTNVLVNDSKQIWKTKVPHKSGSLDTLLRIILESATGLDECVFCRNNVTITPSKSPKPNQTSLPVVVSIH